MFVPYFLFLNVKFNGTVLPFEYQEILGFRYKGIPRTFGPFSTPTFKAFALRACPDIPHHTHAHITHKETRE